MPHETVRTATALELAAAIVQQLPKNIPQDIALGWIGNKTALGKGLRELLMPQTPQEEEVLPACTLTHLSIHNFTSSLSFGEALEKGVYGCISTRIRLWASAASTSCNPTSVPLVLVAFERPVQIHKVHRTLNAQYLQPASFRHLLALGMQKPTLQRDNPIVCLEERYDPSNNGSPLVPYLGMKEQLRCLDVCSYLSIWSTEHRFIAIPR